MPKPIGNPARKAAANSPPARVRSSGEPPFTFGIEEEYFVIDRATGDLTRELPRAIFDELRSVIGKSLSPEYMRSQIEIATPVLTSSDDARELLALYRRRIADVLSPYGLAPLAVATHPFADWREQRHTDRPRYNEIADTLQGLGRRMLANGLHVHIGIEDDDERIRVMNGLRACLPMILALSTSSPFWQSEPTGLKSYRIAINDATPRRGIPERFEDWRAYQFSIETMVRAGMIPDATHLWWDIRPSARFATVETRVADVCPCVDDSVAIAVLIRCMARAIWRRSPGLAPLSRLSQVLINENRWLAQRHGVKSGYIDAASERMKPYAEVFAELLEHLREDAEILDARSELAHLRELSISGSSADRQLAVYDDAIAGGSSERDALKRVTDHLLGETLGAEPAIALSPLRKPAGRADGASQRQ